MKRQQTLELYIKLLTEKAGLERSRYCITIQSRMQWALYYYTNGLSNKSNKDTCKLFQTMFPNSQVAKNFEIASNKIGYMLLCFRTLFYRGIKPTAFNLIRLVYILAMLSVRFRLVIGIQQESKSKVGGWQWSSLPFLEVQRICDLEFTDYVTLLFEWW